MTATDDLTRRLRAVRLLTLDVDGVLTDGALYYASDGSELRRFHVRDGLGIQRVLAGGIHVAFVSASTTSAIAHRAQRLGVPHALLGVVDKLQAVQVLCTELGLDLDAVAHVADDENDLPLLRAVGLAVAVADAMPEVRNAAHHITTTAGGWGAARELCDSLLEAARPAPERSS